MYQIVWSTQALSPEQTFYCDSVQTDAHREKEPSLSVRQENHSNNSFMVFVLAHAIEIQVLAAALEAL